MQRYEEFDNSEFEETYDERYAMNKLRSSSRYLLDIRQNVDPKSKAYSFITYAIDNVNRALEVLNKEIK